MQTVNLLGDSLARGYSLGVFSDEISCTSTLWPLHQLRSMWSMANSVLDENGIPARFAYFGIGSPSEPDAATRIATYINGPLVQPGDWSILIDAGPHNSNPDLYEEMMVAALDAMERDGIARGVVTTPDYSPAPFNSQYDTLFGSRSINAAKLSAAQLCGVPVLDMNAEIDQWRANAQSIDGVAVIQPDGIHGNVWCDAKWVGSLLHFTGLGPYLRSYEGIEKICRDNWQALRYGGGSTWSPTRAAEYASMVITA